MHGIENKVQSQGKGRLQGNVQGPSSKAQLRIWLTQLANGDDHVRHQAFCRVNVWREGMRQHEGIQLLRLLQA